MPNVLGYNPNGEAKEKQGFLQRRLDKKRLRKAVELGDQAR